MAGCFPYKGEGEKQLADLLREMIRIFELFMIPFEWIDDLMTASFEWMNGMMAIIKYPFITLSDKDPLEDYTNPA